MLRRLAAYCYSHRWRVLIAWIVLLVGVNVLAQTVGGDLLKTFNLPGTESQRAFDTLARDFSRKGDTEEVDMTVIPGEVTPEDVVTVPPEEPVASGADDSEPVDD